MNDVDLDQLIKEALTRRGEQLPVTVDEVARVEKLLEGVEVELPKSFEDPLAILRSRTPRRAFSDYRDER